MIVHIFWMWFVPSSSMKHTENVIHKLLNSKTYDVPGTTAASTNLLSVFNSYVFGFGFWKLDFCQLDPGSHTRKI